MRCSEARALLAAHDGVIDSDLGLRRHLATCEECRAEMQHYEQLQGALASLALSRMDVPEDLSAALLAIPDSERLVDTVRGHVARHKRAYLGGLAAAIAGTGAVVWRARSRRPLTA